MDRGRWLLIVMAGAFAAATGTCAAAADDGKQLFHHYCSVCHDTTPGKNKLGPSLAGVVGRHAGTEAGFTYSDAMKHVGITWNARTLDRYLTNPRSVVPGNKMPFYGVKEADQRHAIITYLETLKP
jgi:cytochrome c2